MYNVHLIHFFLGLNIKIENIGKFESKECKFIAKAVKVRPFSNLLLFIFLIN